MSKENVAAIENLSDAEWRAQEEAAKAWPCGISGCDGRGHDFGAPRERWLHGAGKESFDQGAVKVDMFYQKDRGYFSDITTDAYSEMTADELRAEADLYEGYPAWLRAQADKLDALNA